MKTWPPATRQQQWRIGCPANGWRARRHQFCREAGKEAFQMPLTLDRQHVHRQRVFQSRWLGRCGGLLLDINQCDPLEMIDQYTRHQQPSDLRAQYDGLLVTVAIDELIPDHDGSLHVQAIACVAQCFSRQIFEIVGETLVSPGQGIP